MVRGLFFALVCVLVIAGADAKPLHRVDLVTAAGNGQLDVVTRLIAAGVEVYSADKCTPSVTASM
jgi:hypothetical protein